MALEEMTPAVHSLLRVAAASALVWENPGAADVAGAGAGAAGVAPDWVPAALLRLPFVVVRRVAPRAAMLAVGVRGMSRAQRAAAWLPEDAALECLTPRMLAARGEWRFDKFSGSPAVAVLSSVQTIVESYGFEGCWGPGGSVGAELASGVTCTTPDSDLDLILYVTQPPAVADATRLQADLAGLPVRIDTLLETPTGGFALADFVGGADRMLLRTAAGPRLIAAAQGASLLR